MPRVDSRRLSANGAFSAAATCASGDDSPQLPALAGVRRFRLRRLKHEIADAIAAGLTPLVLDPSADHVVDTFFSYHADAIVLDAKRMSLDVAIRNTPELAALDAARKRVACSR